MTTVEAPRRNISAAEARDIAEAAREQEWAAPSFVRELFLGKLRMDLIHPYPEQDPTEIARAKPFLDNLERFLREQVDSDRIDREGEIPEEVIAGLRDLGAFGIKIPRDYGGGGVLALLFMKGKGVGSSLDGALPAPLSPPPPTGVARPPQMFWGDGRK